VDLHLALEEAVRHPLVVDEMARRLPERLVRQFRDVLVVDEEVDGRLREDLDADVVARHRGDLVGREVARHVHVALLEQELLRGGLDHVADHHLFDLRAFLEVAFGGLEPDKLGRAVVGQHERPRAGAVGREPRVAQVAVRLVRHRRHFIDDGGGTRGEDVHHEVGEKSPV
jgi:hypothetical protein